MLKKLTAMVLSLSILSSMAAPTVISAVDLGSDTTVYVSENLGESAGTVIDTDYLAEYSIKDSWGNNQIIEIKITNTSDKDLTGWAVRFEAEGQIENLWGASVFKHERNTYVLEGTPYGSSIKPNASAVLGYKYISETGAKPENIYVYSLNEENGDKSYTVETNKTSGWGDEAVINLIITNNSEKPIKYWSLSFEADFEISQIWNGKLLYSNENTYTIGFDDGTQIIQPNSSVTIGMQCKKVSDTSIRNEKLTENISELNMESLYVYGTYDEETESIILNWNSNIKEGYFTVLFSTDGMSFSQAEIVRDTDSYSYTDDLTAENIYFKVKQMAKDGQVKESNIIKMIKTENGYEMEMTDTDEDGLSDILEFMYGTDHQNPDTDGDGLTDYEELYLTGTDPLKADTDDNGISDADEDPDSDGLKNLEEIELGTDPQSDDTDMDGLKDGEEINQYKTDPLKYDTDEDGISDGDEIIIGLDPLNPATHGVPDNEYTFEQNLSTKDIKVNQKVKNFKIEVDIKASNNAKTVFTSEISSYNEMLSKNRAIIDSSVELNYENGTIESGNIKFSLDKSYIKDKGALYPELNIGLQRYGIFIFDESINTLLPVPCDYDEETGVISVDASKYMGNLCVIDIESMLYDMGVEISDLLPENVPMSLASNIPVANGNDISIINDIKEDELKDILFEKTNSKMMRSIIVPPTSNTIKQVDLVFVLDTTGSMGSAIGKIKTQLAYLISKLRNNGVTLNVAIVDYKDITCGERTITHDFSNNIDDINSMLNSINITGGGDTPETAIDGLGAAEKLSYSKSSKFIFLITDADSKSNNNYGYSGITDVAIALKNKNIFCSVISPSIYNYQPLISYTGGAYISLYSDFNRAMYDFILNNSNKYNYNVLLSGNFQQVSLKEELTYMGSCDTDNDGLTDSEETNWGLIPQFNSSDVNKDVVLKLPKLKDLVSDNKIFLEIMNSNPLMKYLLNIEVLPIKSDPSSEDGDNDGLHDINDPVPLSKTNYGRTYITMNNEDNVSLLQNCLEYLGYLNMEGNPYGTFGGLTSAATQLYQVNHRMYSENNSLKINEYKSSDGKQKRDIMLDEITFYSIILNALNHGFDPSNNNLKNTASNAYTFFANKYIPKSVPLETVNVSMNPDNPVYITSVEKKLNSLGIKDKIYVYDLTVPLDGMLRRGAQEFHFHHYKCNVSNSWVESMSFNFLTYDNSSSRCRHDRSDYIWMIKQVANGKRYDIKTKDSWNSFFNDLNLNVQFYQSSFPFVFRDEEINAEIFGNILYGYAGNSGGYTCSELDFGGSFYSKITTGKRDDEKDSHYIKEGYNMYDDVKKDYYYLHITE